MVATLAPGDPSIEARLVQRRQEFFQGGIIVPVGFPLPLQQRLCRFSVFYPGKTVVLAGVQHLPAIHLSSQPLPSVQANLNRKREPRFLDARVQKTQFRKDLIVIQDQTLTTARSQLQPASLAVADSCPRGN